MGIYLFDMFFFIPALSAWTQDCDKAILHRVHRLTASCDGEMDPSGFISHMID
jgi:hypothetical protein